MPTYLKQLTVAITFFIQLHVTLFFFGPKTAQKQAAILHIVFQICIALTGNYNWFNLNSAILLFPLLSSGFYEPRIWNRLRNLNFTRHQLGQKLPKFSPILDKFCQVLVQFIDYFGILSLAIFDFVFLLKNQFPSAAEAPNIELNFNLESFKAFNENYVFYLLLLVMVLIFLVEFWQGKLRPDLATEKLGYRKKLTQIYRILKSIPAFILLYMMCYSQLETWCFNTPNGTKIVTKFTRWRHSGYKYLNNKYTLAFSRRYKIASGYGLFAKMTGVHDGRPEIDIKVYNRKYSERDKQFESTGKKFEKRYLPLYFRYKPTHYEQQQSWTFLHQPRLDWQMWFLALDLVNLEKAALPHLLLYRILHNSPDVWALLDQYNNPKYTDTDWPLSAKVSTYYLRYTGPFNTWRAEEEKWIDKAVAKTDNVDLVWYYKIFRNSHFEQKYDDKNIEKSLVKMKYLGSPKPKQTWSHRWIKKLLDKLIDWHRNSFLDNHASGINALVLLIMMVVQMSKLVREMELGQDKLKRE